MGESQRAPPWVLTMGWVMAAALAVLQDKSLKHGPIEVLLTIDEETGMTGAFQLEQDCWTERS